MGNFCGPLNIKDDYQLLETGPVYMTHYIVGRGHLYNPKTAVLIFRK
jgi:hypothetical protein